MKKNIQTLENELNGLDATAEDYEAKRDRIEAEIEALKAGYDTNNVRLVLSVGLIPSELLFSSNNLSTETGESKGNNRIVIQTYDKRADLELVQYYFAEGGIETEIRKIGDTFYLVSADKYEKDPKIEGTDGYAAKQKIIEWGARYKAPQGYETFGAKSFETAYGRYGMKFDD